MIRPSIYRIKYKLKYILELKSALEMVKLQY